MHIYIALGLGVQINARREAHLALNEADKLHSKLQRNASKFDILGNQTHLFQAILVCDHIYH